MGSQIVEAVVAQIGKIHTNPNHLSPDNREPSRPIEQVPHLSTYPKPIQQRATLTLYPDWTNPLEQRGLLQTDPVVKVPIEQRLLFSGYEDADEGLFEQRIFRTFRKAGGIDDSKPLQQASVAKTSETGSKPVQQVPNPTADTDVLQYDFLDLVFPSCNSIKNPVETSLIWRIRDAGFEFNTETLVFKVNGSPVQNASTFSVTPLVNGLQFDYDPSEDFSYNSEVEVFLEIDDTADPPNHFAVICRWQTVPDTLGPVVVNMQPLCNSIGADQWDPVEFDVLDIGEWVDLDSIRLTIEGITVCDGVSFEPITVPGSGSGYHVTYEHSNDPFRFDASITVGVTAQDLAEPSNSTLFICFFGVRESEVPVFRNFVPAPCASFVDNTTGLEFEVYGVEHGVDISTLEVRIDNKLRKVIARPRILRSQ